MGQQPQAVEAVAANGAGHRHPRHHQCFCHMSGLMQRFQPSPVSQGKPSDRFLYLSPPSPPAHDGRLPSPPVWLFAAWALSSRAPGAELPQPARGRQMNILSPESDVSSQGQPVEQTPSSAPARKSCRIPSGRHWAQLLSPLRWWHP